MEDRKTILKFFRKKYENANLIQKSQILNDFGEMTGYTRSYASRLLRGSYKHHKGEKTANGRRYYGEDVRGPLIKIWEILDMICGKRMAAFLPEMVDILEKHGELDITDDVRTKLKTISASTIDRLLAPARKRLGRRGKSMTKQPEYLIDRIPIKTFTEWKHSPPGFTQVDLVSHNGGDVYGGFLHTLSSMDVATTWTICTLMRDKTMLQMVR